jgi:outer membrane protein, heavy metal efflux system
MSLRRRPTHASAPWRRFASVRRWAAVAAIAAGLSGCAGLQGRASTDTPSLNRPLAALDVDAARFAPETPPKPCTFDPDKGMDGTEVAILAVLNNPQLGAERADAKVAGAQLFAAGVLPRPSLERHPRSTLAQALVARVASRMAGAAVTAPKVHLTLLWDEWQVAQAARLLYARRLTDQQTLNVLKGFAALFKAQQQREQAAGSGAADTMLAARLDVERRMAALRGASARDRRTLNAVLGLAPDLDLPLVAGNGLSAPNNPSVSSLLKRLGDRRPDLVALGIGARSGGRLLRETVLARFPPIRVALQSEGPAPTAAAPNVDVQFPFFDDSLGRVDPKLATRAYLHHQRVARIASDSDLVRSLEAHYRYARQRLNARSAGLSRLQESVERARAAYQAGQLPGGAFLTLEQTLLTHQLAWLDARYAVLELHIAMQSLLFAPIDS